MTHHVQPTSIYYRVFAALLVLTGTTVAVAFCNLAFLNTMIAMTIAVCKALLVVLYFMHVRYSSRLLWLFVGAGFFWLAIMLVLGMADYLTRGPISFPSGLPPM